MREVISTLFKRSTLTFMSAVLALSSLMPLASAQTAYAAPLSSEPLTVATSCGDNGVELTLAGHNSLGANVHIKQYAAAPYGGETKPIWDMWTIFPNSSKDFVTVETGQMSIPAGSVSAHAYLLAVIDLGWFHANYPAMNCDVTAPTAEVSYSTTTLTNTSVVATLTASEPLQDNIPNWTMVDSTHFQRTYTTNTVETVAYKDLAGNIGSTNVAITWIDNSVPVGNATYKGGVKVGDLIYVRSIDELKFTETIDDNNGVVRATYLVQKWNTATNKFEGFCGNWNANSLGSHTLGGASHETYTENNVGHCITDQSKWTDGKYQIFHAAYDEAGNEGKYNTNRQAFVIDSTKPSVTDFRIDNETAVYQNEIKASAIVTDTNLKDVTFYISVAESTFPDGSLKCTGNGSPVVSAAGILNGGRYEAVLDTSSLNGKNYCVSVKASDLAKNNSSPVGRKLVTIDNTAPTITIKDGYVGNKTSKIFSNVSFHLFDANQVDKYVINTHISDFTNNNWSDANFQNIKAHLIQGLNTFTLYDVAGNSATYEFTYDSVAPDAPLLLSPANGAVVRGENLVNDWEDVNGVDHYVYQSFNVKADGSCNLNSKRFSGIGYVFTGSETNSRNVNDLAYCWQVKSVDAAGNESGWSTLWKTVVDNTAPVASITNPLDGAFLNGVVTLSGEVADNNPMNSHFRIEGPNGYLKTETKSNGLALHTLVWNTVGLEDGEYTIYFETRDKAENKDGSRSNLGPSVDKVVVTVDNTNPVVTLIDFAAVANVITPNITADDANLPLTYAWTAADVDSDANVTISDTNVLMPEFTVNVDGTYGFNLVVTDTTGNSTTQLFTFTYTTPVVPEEPADTNDDGATTNNGGFTNVGLNEGDEDVLGEETQDNNQSSGEESESGEILGASTEDKDNSWAPFGIVWYWWLLILAALAVLARLFVVVRRRLAQDEA